MRYWYGLQACRPTVAVLNGADPEAGVTRWHCAGYGMKPLSHVMMRTYDQLIRQVGRLRRL